MARKTSADLVKETRREVAESQRRLRLGDVGGAQHSARLAFRAARAQRSHRLISEAWIPLLDALSADDSTVGVRAEYEDTTEGAYAWVETMPEEIQTWFLPALEPHLEAIGSIRHLERARAMRAQAENRLSAGQISVSTRTREWQLDDLEHDRVVDPKALALERTAAFYADELFDPDGQYLEVAASAWSEAGRPDRAELLLELVGELRRR